MLPTIDIINNKFYWLAIFLFCKNVQKTAAENRVGQITTTTTFFDLTSPCLNYCLKQCVVGAACNEGISNGFSKHLSNGLSSNGVSKLASIDSKGTLSKPPSKR